MGKQKNQPNQLSESTQSSCNNNNVSKTKIAFKWKKIAQKGVMLKRAKDAQTADELSSLFEPAVAISNGPANQMDVEQSTSSSFSPN